MLSSFYYCRLISQKLTFNYLLTFVICFLCRFSDSEEKMPIKYLSLSLCIICNMVMVLRSSPCDSSKKVCEYWLVLEEELTMVHGKDIVYGKGGHLYKYYDHWSNATSTVPNEEVISVDGFHRMVVAFNKSIPGPPIIVYEGQTVIIHLHNRLLSESTTIHWHGLHQKGTPWMDGVGYITQCPIGPGQTFTYKFKASPKGTYWYHSHVGAQRTNGGFGSFIVKERAKRGTAEPRDMLMTVGDWHHFHSSEVYLKMLYGNFVQNKKYKTTSSLEGGRFSNVPWVSGLIDGKGRHISNDGTKADVPLSWYNVTKGETVRFRVIGVGSLYPVRISVDNHNITVVASDGYDIEDTVVESFIIHPGERFDFLLTASQSIGNYWLRAVSMEVGVTNHSVEAIIHYSGASDKEPNTTRKNCTKDNSCLILNCPFSYFPAESYTKCLTIGELRAKDPEPTPMFVKGDSKEHFLNFHFPGIKVTPGAVNGRKFSIPGVSSLTQHNEIEDEYDCDKKDCGVDKVCHCHYQLNLPYNKTIQMVWMNMGRGKGWSHPIHLHGHSFYVLKMGYPQYNKTTGQFLSENPDVDCGGDPKLNFCNEAKWKNKSWENGNVPGLNLKNPPRKDSLLIPTGGYAVLRIRSNNPGKWFLHCHIEVHAINGMAMVINEALDKSPKPPKRFPVCQHFYNDPSRDLDFNTEQIDEQPKPPMLNTLSIALLAALCTVLLLMVAYVIVLKLKKTGTKVYPFRDANHQQPRASITGIQGLKCTNINLS